MLASSPRGKTDLCTFTSAEKSRLQILLLTLHTYAFHFLQAGLSFTNFKPHCVFVFLVPSLAPGMLPLQSSKWKWMSRMWCCSLLLDFSFYRDSLIWDILICMGRTSISYYIWVPASKKFENVPHHYQIGLYNWTNLLPFILN